jgi:ribose-phosphate pyrophosphokinase
VRDMAIFSGTAHPQLAAAIGHHLGVPVSPARLKRFANDCLEVQLQANCRERDVFLVQPIVPPTQEHLVELLLMIDAARGASAGRITVVMPHYAYARSDKKDAPRISIGARLVADLIAAAGANRVLTMTLHSPQVHGFFSVPVDHLHALHELAGHFRAGELANSIVMSPDLGNAKTATAFSRMLGVPVAAAAKQRVADDKVVISSIIGDVRGRDVIVLDDEIARGSTILRRPRRRADPAAPGGRRDRLHQHRPGARGARHRQAHGALGGAGARRGDAPDPQRRVGERAVRRTAGVGGSRPTGKIVSR